MIAEGVWHWPLPHISRRENSANKIIHTAFAERIVFGQVFQKSGFPFIKAAVDKTRVEVYTWITPPFAARWLLSARLSGCAGAVQGCKQNCAKR